MNIVLETIYIVIAGILAVCLPSVVIAAILFYCLKWVDIKKDEEK